MSVTMEMRMTRERMKNWGMLQKMGRMVKQENEYMVGNRGIFNLLPTADSTSGDSAVLLRAFISSMALS